MDNQNDEQGAKIYDRKPNFNTRAKLSRDGRYWIIERVETWIFSRKYLDVIAQNHAAEGTEPPIGNPDAKPKRKGKRDANSDGQGN